MFVLFLQIPIMLKTFVILVFAASVARFVVLIQKYGSSLPFLDRFGCFSEMKVTFPK